MGRRSPPAARITACAPTGCSSSTGLAPTRIKKPVRSRDLAQPGVASGGAAGGAELQLGTEPDLFLDGRCCCDQLAAHHLVRAGFIAATTLGLVGQRVAAALTPAGQQALGAYALAA